MAERSGAAAFGEAQRRGCSRPAHESPRREEKRWRATRTPRRCRADDGLLRFSGPFVCRSGSSDLPVDRPFSARSWSAVAERSGAAAFGESQRRGCSRPAPRRALVAKKSGGEPRALQDAGAPTMPCSASAALSCAVADHRIYPWTVRFPRGLGVRWRSGAELPLSARPRGVAAADRLHESSRREEKRWRATRTPRRWRADDALLRFSGAWWHPEEAFRRIREESQKQKKAAWIPRGLRNT